MHCTSTAAVGAGIAAITNHMAFSGSPRWMAIAPSALAPRSATLDQARMDTLHCAAGSPRRQGKGKRRPAASYARSEEHTSELQSRRDLVCRLLLEKKKEECSIR